MHAYLICGQDRAARLTAAQASFKETGVVEKIELGPESPHTIEAVRNLRHQLALKTREDAPRGVLLPEVQLLTTEAANAFLKTLEEPPPNTLIILTAPNPGVVLPTIVSRCLLKDLGPQVLEISGEEKEAARTLFEKLIRGGVGEKMHLVDQIKGKDEGLAFLVGQIQAARRVLLNKPAAKTVQLLERLEKTHQDLQGNVNPRLAIADLLLHYPTK